jgi:hypothetical protein
MSAHKGTIMLRKLLMQADTKLIQQVIDMNLIPILMEHLKNTEHPHLMLEATWCVANLSYGTTSQIDTMVKKGLFDSLKMIMSSPHEKIFEQGAWAVGNISVGNEQFR